MGSVCNDVFAMDIMPSEKDLSCSTVNNNKTNNEINSATDDTYGASACDNINMTSKSYTNMKGPLFTSDLHNSIETQMINNIDTTYKLTNNTNKKPPAPKSSRSFTSHRSQLHSGANKINTKHCVNINEDGRIQDGLPGETLTRGSTNIGTPQKRNSDLENSSELEKLRHDLELIQLRLEQLDIRKVKKETIVEEAVLTTEQRANRNRVLINIGGTRHEIYRSTLKNIPDTRLSWIAEESATHSPEYDPIAGEFFFDRHPQVFSHILNYYRTGNLHVPYDVCGPLFEDELSYWGIDDSQVESCCWLTYRQHRDAQETLKEFEGVEFEKDFDDDSEPDLSKYGFNVENRDDMTEELTWYQKWQPIIWKMVEDPYSSLKAKVFTSVSMCLILLSVVMFCLETMSYFKNDNGKETMFTIIEGFCVTFFTVELCTRFAFCPEKKLFWRGLMNWIDLLSIIPFFITLIAHHGFRSNNELSYLQIIRVVRVFRIIKLSKHSVGLQILGHTLKASIRELLLLIFFLIIGIVIFSSLVYYCEHQEKNTKFNDIPTTFWWAVITMTTVGYGDMVPETVLGKLVGSLCSICGVLMIALPVPVIVNNFNLYYSHAQARLKLPKKKRRVLCGAANALKGPAMEEFERRELEETHEDHDSETEGVVESDGQNTNVFIPRQRNRTTQQPSVEISHNSEDEELEENKPASLRLKKFARRDSNIFSSTKAQLQQEPQEEQYNGGVIKLHSPSRAPLGRPEKPYALNKRRSLLPTMNSLPEIEY